MVRESVEKVFGSLHLGALPRQALPSLFLQSVTNETQGPSQQGQPGQRDNRRGGASGQRENRRGPDGNNGDDPAWFREATERPPAGIAIPTGKTFQELFANANVANAQNWPRARHHSTGMDQRLCIRYLTTGQCTRGGSCRLTHTTFSRLSDDLKRTVRERLQGIYN